MPNHITNILHVEGDNPEKVFEQIKGNEERPFIDFNRVIQMPEVMEGDFSDMTVEKLAKLFLGEYSIRELFSPEPVDGVAAFQAGDYGAAAGVLERNSVARMLLETKLAGDLDDEKFELLIKYMRAFRQFGCFNWHDWSRQYWGTKWNAYDQSRVDERTIKFDTAWSTPGPIWSKLSEMFPENVIAFRWADEDLGANTGKMRVAGGSILEGGPFENYSPEAYKNAVEIRYDNKLPDYCRWKDDGTVEYVDDDDAEDDSDK